MSKQKHKTKIWIVSFIVLVVSVFYISNIPTPPHWTLLVPWGLALVLFIQNRWRPIETEKKTVGRKIKRYV